MIPKFRAWLPTLQWMCNVSAILFDEKSLDVYKLGDTERVTEMSVDQDEVTLLRSTDLFDKNSVEIFEGDIVVQTKTQPTTENEKIVGVVTMIEGAWLIINDVDQLACYLWSEVDENEILGNIYENPELLEVKDG